MAWPRIFATLPAGNNPSSYFDDNFNAVPKSLQLTGAAGTNAITATSFSPFTAYATGQLFVFIPANTNTGATTLQINAIATPINVFCGGAACVGGEIRQNVPCAVFYDGTQFNIIGPYVGGNLPTGQIKFPATQNPSSNVRTLDDYVEISWVPTDGSGAGLALTVVTDGCFQVKVGQNVFTSIDITFPVTANGSNSVISSLGIVARDNTNATQSQCILSISLGDFIFFIVQPNTGNIWPYNKAGTRLTNANLSAITLRGVFSYASKA